MLIVLCYKYLIMHVYIVQSDFHVRQIPFTGNHSPHTALPHLVEPPPACGSQGDQYLCIVVIVLNQNAKG